METRTVATLAGNEEEMRPEASEVQNASLSRRGILAVLGCFVAAPAVIRTPGLLMPVRSIKRAFSVDLIPPLMLDDERVWTIPEEFFVVPPENSLVYVGTYGKYFRYEFGRWTMVGSS